MPPARLAAEKGHGGGKGASWLMPRLEELHLGNSWLSTLLGRRPGLRSWRLSQELSLLHHPSRTCLHPSLSSFSAVAALSVTLPPPTPGKQHFRPVFSPLWAPLAPLPASTTAGPREPRGCPSRSMEMAEGGPISQRVKTFQKESEAQRG